MTLLRSRQTICGVACKEAASVTAHSHLDTVKAGLSHLRCLVTTPLVFLTILLVLGVLHLILLVATPVILPVNLDDARSFMLTLWQVAAALLGLAFVVLVLTLETISRSARYPVLWRGLSSKADLYAVVALILGTILSTGFGSLLLLRATDGATITALSLPNLLIIDAALFATSAIMLLQLYLRAFSFMDPAFAQKTMIAILCDAYNRAVQEVTLGRFRDFILSRECSRLGMVYDQAAYPTERFVPIHLPKHGVIVDIDISVLDDIADHIAGHEYAKAVVTMNVGNRITAYRDSPILVPYEDATERMNILAARCFSITKSKQPDEEGDIDDAFASVVDQAIAAIERRQELAFTRSLDGLLQPILAAAVRLRRLDAGADAGGPYNFLGFQARLFERPLEEYARILEHAVKSDDQGIMLEATYWPMPVMTASIEIDDHFYYRRALEYVPRLYDIGRGALTDASKQTM